MEALAPAPPNTRKALARARLLHTPVCTPPHAASGDRRFSRQTSPRRPSPSRGSCTSSTAASQSQRQPPPPPLLRRCTRPGRVRSRPPIGVPCRPTGRLAAAAANLARRRAAARRPRRPRLGRQVLPPLHRAHLRGAAALLQRPPATPSPAALRASPWWKPRPSPPSLPLPRPRLSPSPSHPVALSPRVVASAAPLPPLTAACSHRFSLPPLPPSHRFLPLATTWALLPAGRSRGGHGARGASPLPLGDGALPPLARRQGRALLRVPDPATRRRARGGARGVREPPPPPPPPGPPAQPSSDGGLSTAPSPLSSCPGAPRTARP